MSKVRVAGFNMFGPVCGPWQDDSWKGWWVVPVLLGQGEPLFDGLDLHALGFP